MKPLRPLSSSALLLVLCFAAPRAGQAAPKARGASQLAAAQTAWWQAQGSPRRVRWSRLEQRQLARMSRIGTLSVDTFFKRVTVSKSDGKGGRWVYSLEKAGEDTVARRTHYGQYSEPVAIVSERTFVAGGANQIFKTWTFRQGEKPLPERFREAVMGLGPGRRDIVSIQKVFAGGKLQGTGIAVTPAGRDFGEPGIVDGAFARVPRRKTAVEAKISALYQLHVSKPLAQVLPHQFRDHRAYVQKREQVISAGQKIVAGQLGMSSSALQTALDAMLRR